ITGFGTKLLTDGKTGFITGLCSKKTSTYHGNHRPAIKQVMSRLDVAGRLQKWSIMLGEHNITYRPRTSIKGQFLADFLNELPSNASQGVSVAEIQEEQWTLFTDGSSCVDGSGAGLILTNPDGVEFTYALRFQFAASNNEAEYEALIAGLRIATQMRVRNIQANVDSKLVANQVLGAYVAKEDNMIKYLEITKGLVSGFKTFSISQVPWSRNKKADALRKIASTSFAHLSKQVLVEVLETKSITGKEVTAVIEEEGPTWMTELVNYLKEGILPGDEKEARKLRLKARQYELMEGILYKRSFLTPWLRCVGPLQAEYVMKEIHEGSCSMHAGPQSVVAKAIRLRYFWLTMHKDAQDMIRKCSDCQIHCPVTRHPQQPLTPITAPWPFYKWGIDIVGPFPEGSGKVKFLIVAMDYFTKWIEAKAVATITGGQVKKFVWDNIVCRFAVDVVNNDDELRLNLDLLEERRELATMNEAKSKSKMMKYYNSRVRGVASPGSVYRPEWGVTNGNLLDTPEACQDLVDHVALRATFMNCAICVARRDKIIEARELEIKNLEALLETEADMKRAAEDKSAGLIKELEDMRARFSDLQVSHWQLSQQVASLKEQVSGEEKLKAAFEQFKQYEDERVERRCAKLDARLDALSIDFDEELYPHMLTAIAGRRWVVGHGLRLAMMKCAKSLEMRQAFVDVVSAGVTKGMSEGLKHGIEHGQAQLTVKSIEAYDPEAKAKFVAALQSLKDLKYPLLDQLEGLKDAPMDVIMAALYLENDTEGDAPQYIRDLRPSSYQLTIPCTRRSDGVPVSVPTVVPHGLAFLLVDAATQTDLEDA
nr:reverse transcriptase domain-containing protein [Tanacetum cinerariifolium]